MNDTVLLSLLIFLPSLGALLVAFFPRGAAEGVKQFSFAITVATLAVSGWLLAQYTQTEGPGMQMQVVYAWIPTYDIYYRLGVDGISMSLVLLTTLISALAMLASWNIKENIRPADSSDIPFHTNISTAWTDMAPQRVIRSTEAVNRIQ